MSSSLGVVSVRRGAMTPIQQLSNWLSTATSGVAFTGAGISTESGLSDFRSPGGIWARTQPVMYDDFLTSRSERARYWAARVELYQELKDAQPNDGHRAIAELERTGKIAAVITQNIDGLHQDAGSLRVIELHGTARRAGCVSCDREWAPEEIIARIKAGDDAPECDACGSPIKSKTISFGQPMPAKALRQASELSAACDLCLAIGSSLVVEPAASLPQLAKRSGARLVIINKTPTPLDHLADLVIRAPIGETLTAALSVS